MLANDADYRFTLYDTIGDGICCANGDGDWILSATDIDTGALVVIGRTTNFTDSITVPFSLPYDDDAGLALSRLGDHVFGGERVGEGGCRQVPCDAAA